MKMLAMSLKKKEKGLKRKNSKMEIINRLIKWRMKTMNRRKRQKMMGRNFSQLKKEISKI